MNDHKLSRHRKLVQLINEIEESPVLPIVKEEYNSDEVYKIKREHIIHATVAFTDILGIGGGSIGDIDLYELLQAYLTKPECRVQMNNIAGHALHTSKITKSV